MSAADIENDGDANERLAEEDVDVSQLKIAAFAGWAPGSEVKSGEEDEEPLYTDRARLYVRTEGEWKERGVGEVKLLKHKETGFTRIILRQDKTLKLRLNHKVQPAATLAPNAGNDKSWVFTAQDFAEEKLETHSFALKFKDADVAKAFQKAYDAARDSNKALIESGAKGKAPASPAKTTAAPAAAGAGSSAAAPAAAAPASAKKEEAAPASAKKEEVPVTESASSADSLLRFGALAEAFQREFGFAPSFFARAPGRVNLIGEHVDYHQYSVLPCALSQQDVVIAVGNSDNSNSNGKSGVVRVANINGAKFPSSEIPSDPSAPVELGGGGGGGGGPKWYGYVQCGYKGAMDWARRNKNEVKEVEEAPLCLMVDGRVPPAAGLSSSSALVVASLLATAHALGFAATTPDEAASKNKMTRADIAEAARAAELHIGTMSGGMDQAISCLGEQGEAARIDFFPKLKATSVKLPDDAVFVVAHTLENAAKAVDAEKGYNRRVTEGALASKLLAKKLGVPDWSSCFNLFDVQTAMKLPSPSALLSAIDKLLPDGPVSIADLEAADLLGAPLDSLFTGSDRKTLGAKAVIASLGKGDKELFLRARARHVASEANRVFDFQAACEGKVRKADGVSTMPMEGGSDARLKAMGDLMNASQASCAEDYDCSSPGLNELTALARASGALGSRLTGAGWGGCSVSLIRASQVDSFIDALKRGYYHKRGKTDDKELSQYLFASAPGSGVYIYRQPATFEV